jgi:hypothetical protein
VNEQRPDQLSSDPPVPTPDETGKPIEARAPEAPAHDVAPKRKRGRPKGSVSRNKPAPAARLTVEERIAPHAHLIGTLSNIQIAALAKVHPWEVEKYRAERRAQASPPQVASPSPVAASESVDPESVDPESVDPESVDYESADSPPVVAEAAPSREPGRRVSRIDAFRDLVGVLPDAEVAARAGVTTSGVLQYRQRHGIPAAGRKVEAPDAQSVAGRPRPPSRIEPFHHLVGVLSDGEVAAQAGVTANAVQMYRRKRGIPAAPAGAGGRTPVPALRAEAGGSPARPVASPRSGRSNRVFGWRITLQTARGEVVRYAVASDAEAACLLADGLGEVARIERLGEALA